MRCCKRASARRRGSADITIRPDRKQPRGEPAGRARCPPPRPPIPRLLDVGRRALRRSARARRGRRRRARLRGAARARRCARRARFIARGRRARRPRRDLGAELLGVDRRRARPPVRGRRARAAQHAASRAREAGYILRKSGARVLCTVDGLPRHRLRRLAARARRCPTLERDRAAARRGAPARCRFADFLRAAATRCRRGRARARAGGRARRPLRHALHLGHHRPAEGRDDRARARTCACSRPGAECVGLREGDRYLIVNPFFHSLRLQGGLALVPDARRDRRCRTRSSTCRRCSRASRASASACCPGRRRSTSRSSRTRSARRYDLSSLRLAVTGAAVDPGRADPAHARRARLRDGHHRLRPHRDLRHASPCAARATTPRRSPRRRAARSPASRCAASTPDGAEVPRGEPGEVVVRGYNVMHGYFEDRSRDARGDRRATAGCTPATSA